MAELVFTVTLLNTTKKNKKKLTIKHEIRCLQVPPFK